MSLTDVEAAMQAKLDRAMNMSDEEKVYRYKGVLYPTVMCPEENLKALENFEAREDDVVMVSYPKSGFNWVSGVTRKIVAEATGTKAESRMPPPIEFLGPDHLKMLDKAPSPRFLGTHMHPDTIHASFYEKKTKMLVVLRNPKDNLVSYYHFSSGHPVLPGGKTWDAFFSAFMSGEVSWGSYFDHALAWEKRMDNPNIKIITYEELKEDLSRGIRDISSFFGFVLTEAQVQQITEASSFRAMKENSSTSHASHGNVFFRKGEVGDWKNHFSPEQSKEMDEAFNKKLAGTRLGAKLNYEKYCQ